MAAPNMGQMTQYKFSVRTIGFYPQDCHWVDSDVVKIRWFQGKKLASEICGTHLWGYNDFAPLEQHRHIFTVGLGSGIPMWFPNLCTRLMCLMWRSFLQASGVPLLRGYGPTDGCIISFLSSGLPRSSNGWPCHIGEKQQATNHWCLEGPGMVNPNSKLCKPYNWGWHSTCDDPFCLLFTTFYH